mgnify:CR=1 FL=1
MEGGQDEHSLAGQLDQTQVNTAPLSIHCQHSDSNQVPNTCKAICVWLMGPLCLLWLLPCLLCLLRGCFAELPDVNEAILDNKS